MSTSTEEKGKWFDFEAVKASAVVPDVLSYYGLTERLARRENEFVGWCPLGTKKHGKKDSFNFNVKKKTFKCFACKSHGSTLDFVAQYQGLYLRDACEVLVMINDGTAPQAPLSRNNFEEIPEDSLVEPASEASEQTRVFTQLAEKEGDAMHSPSADDPAIVVGALYPNKHLSKYILSLSSAEYLIKTGKKTSSDFVVIDKDFLYLLTRFFGEPE